MLKRAYKKKGSYALLAAIEPLIGKRLALIHGQKRRQNTPFL